MSKYVLDASAVLAYLQEEKGSDAIAEFLDEAVISAVNAAEVVGKLALAGASPDEAERYLHALQVPVVRFGPEHMISTGMLSVATRKSGLSLGDRACLATAAVLGATAITTDRLWARPKLQIPVQVIR